MWNFIKSLFLIKPSYPFSTGAYESPVDTRDISIAQVQMPVSIPREYKTDISMLPVENQLSLGTCVAQSTMKLVQYYIYKKTGKITDLSARAIYKWAKEQDGLPAGMQGTYPSVIAKVITKLGIPLANFLPNFNWLSHSDFIGSELAIGGKEDALTRVLGGYAFVPADFEAIKQAIYQNGVITGVTDVDTNWFAGIIKKLTNLIGRHNTLWVGYDAFGIYGRNSWGGWIGKIFGFFNLNDGEFYFKWEDYKNNVYDIIAYVDIPEKLIEDTKKNYIFYNNLKVGSTGPEVIELQKRLNKEQGTFLVTDGKFGTGTRNVLIQYQLDHQLIGDGTLGALTRAKLNGQMTYLVDWCDAIKMMEGAKPSRNNPGNIRYRGQQYAVNDNGFCKFDTYEHGYEALKNLLIRACTGKSALYSPEMSLYEFYAGVYNPNGTKKYPGYAPKEDGNDPVNYANFVAKHLGIPVTKKIKELL